MATHRSGRHSSHGCRLPRTLRKTWGRTLSRRSSAKRHSFSSTCASFLVCLAASVRLPNSTSSLWESRGQDTYTDQLLKTWEKDKEHVDLLFADLHFAAGYAPPLGSPMRRTTLHHWPTGTTQMNHRKTPFLQWCYCFLHTAVFIILECHIDVIFCCTVVNSYRAQGFG